VCKPRDGLRRWGTSPASLHFAKIPPTQGAFPEAGFVVLNPALGENPQVIPQLDHVGPGQPIGSYMCLWLPVVVVSGVGRGVVVGQRAGRLVIFTSEPGSPSQQALTSLGF
jgi:hypothetical protein